MLLRTWLPYDWTPRSEAYFASPLALCARRVSTATGGYQPSLRSPWLAAVYDLSGLDTGFFPPDHYRYDSGPHRIPGLSSAISLYR
ncbi:hypothetical protein [Thiolapillus sp.]|uniref:hypothetical protein n=1 Tax=Thiolapillus sp. TaxID=2017437 RepID=UPI003AF7F0E3